MNNPLRKFVEFYFGKHDSRNYGQELDFITTKSGREEKIERLRKICEESHKDFLFDFHYNAGRRGLIRFYS